MALSPQGVLLNLLFGEARERTLRFSHFSIVAKKKVSEGGLGDSQIGNELRADSKK